MDFCHSAYIKWNKEVAKNEMKLDEHQARPIHIFVQAAKIGTK